MLNVYFIYYQIITFFSLGLASYLSILIFFSNRKSAISQLFILHAFLNLFWSTAPFFVSLLEDYRSVFIYIKLGYGMAPLATIVSYFLVINIFPKIKRIRALDVAAFIFGFSGFLVAISSFFVKRIELTEWGANPVLGQIQFVYFAALIFNIILILYLILKGYFSAGSSEKSEYLLFLIGLLLNIGVSTVANVIFPLLGHTIARSWLVGSLGPLFTIIFAAMAIFKGQAFGIKTILTDFLVGVLGISLLSIPFFFSGLVRIFGSILFILFSIIGYYLIIYTHREVRQKEILEEKVKERTVELQAALDDVQKRKHDLEKFYSLTVGRELKMVELKKKIQDLEEKKN